MDRIIIGPSNEARADLVAWLGDVLQDAGSAERMAVALISNNDWSARTYVEVPGFYTVDGNPTVYTFAEGDLIVA